jgi:DnaJ-class molecular chaperone
VSGNGIGKLPWHDRRTGERYGTRKCPTCSGRGVNPMLPTMVCPKCHGEGRVAEQKS